MKSLHATLNILFSVQGALLPDGLTFDTMNTGLLLSPAPSSWDTVTQPPFLSVALHFGAMHFPYSFLPLECSLTLIPAPPPHLLAITTWFINILSVGRGLVEQKAFS